MVLPRSAFGASLPGGRRQRTGQAGSAAVAWGHGAVLAAALGLVAPMAVAAEGPVIEPARAGSTCVADPAFMRRNHMQLLKHQRDDTVRGGIRGADARFSLRQCVDCHASATTHSVAAAPTNFCVSCHSYAAVRIDCFECHTPKASAVATGAAR